MEWTQKDLDRFWSKVEKKQGCWEWIGPIASHGYGRFTRGRKWEDTSHRIAFALSHGPIPEGLVVRHRCDNKRCCNPAHLELGPQGENVRDMFRRGQIKTQLSMEQVREIRARLADGRRGIGKELAAEFGTSPDIICRIGKGRIYQEDWR